MNRADVSTALESAAHYFHAASGAVKVGQFEAAAAAIKAGRNLVGFAVEMAEVPIREADLYAKSATKKAELEKLTKAYALLLLQGKRDQCGDFSPMTEWDDHRCPKCGLSRHNIPATTPITAPDCYCLRFTSSDTPLIETFGGEIVLYGTWEGRAAIAKRSCRCCGGTGRRLASNVAVPK